MHPPTPSAAPGSAAPPDGQVLGLSPRQQEAVRLLLKGRRDTEVATELGIARETVNRWKRRDNIFKAALEAERKRLWVLEGTDETKQRIEVVLATPLLSLAGLRARLELKDYLILQDLGAFNERRARLVQRLEVDVEQAQHYSEMLTKDDSITQQLAIRLTDYKTALIRVLMQILKEEVPSPEGQRRILERLGERMGPDA